MAVQGDQAATSQRSPTPLLDRISSPADLKSLPLSQLPVLAAEIRQELIDIVTRNGGHLGASLGAIELAIALHWVFDSPRAMCSKISSSRAVSCGNGLGVCG